jgi:hypothetical protein
MRSETERKKMDNKYNGWANYETWNFKLWLDNEQINAIINVAVKLYLYDEDG